MVMVALAFLLYLVKVFQLPEGGSITLGSMVPIFLLSFRRGAKVGVASGTVLGLIILYYEKFIYNPFQVFLDYPLAFAVLGISGLFRRNPFVGIGVAISARFACHFLSGVLFFQSFAPEGTNPILYSVLYNASYLVPEFIISVAVMYFLMKRDILAVRL